MNCYRNLKGNLRESMAIFQVLSIIVNCQQCVKINNHFSDLLPVLSGIPQGSILTRTNSFLDLYQWPSWASAAFNFILFADDTKCFKSIHDFSDYLHLQADLNSLYGWSIRSNLLFSLSKIIFMSFKSTIPTSYTIRTNNLYKSETHCDLGVIISAIYHGNHIYTTFLVKS